MSRIGQIHNDYLDPDKHLWPTEEWGEEISKVLEALAAWDSGRWHYAPVSAGRGICLTGKDSDLERSGQQGIEVLGANDDGVRIKLHAGATFAGHDVCLNLRPQDDEDDATSYAYRDAYLDQAGLVMEGIPFPGEWGGDDWYIHHESSPIWVDWATHIDDNGEEIEIDYAATAAAIVQAAEEGLKDWEREIGLAHDILDTLAGWKDKDGNDVPAKGLDDPALPLLPLDDDGNPILPDRQDPEDDGMTDVEADADVLRSAGMGTDEDYGYYPWGEE